MVALGSMLVSQLLLLPHLAVAFHDCIQPKSERRLPPNLREALLAAPAPAGCSGGLCVGMHGGPHENGPAPLALGGTVNVLTLPLFPY